MVRIKGFKTPRYAAPVSFSWMSICNRLYSYGQMYRENIMVWKLANLAR